MDNSELSDNIELSDDIELSVATTTGSPDGPLVPPDAPDHENWNVSPSDVTSAADDWRMESPGMPFSSDIMYSLTSCPRNSKLFFAWSLMASTSAWPWGLHLGAVIVLDTRRSLSNSIILIVPWKCPCSGLTTRGNGSMGPSNSRSSRPPAQQKGMYLSWC